MRLSPLRIRDCVILGCVALALAASLVYLFDIVDAKPPESLEYAISLPVVLSSMNSTPDPSPTTLVEQTVIPVVTPTPGKPPKPREPSVFGIEIVDGLTEEYWDDIAALGVLWVRKNGLLWKDIEPIEGGGYRWDAEPVRLLEQDMLRASARGLRLILIVRGSPAWATEVESDCAAIKPDSYEDFAAFMAAAVERYSEPPFNVKYWEIGNEPDVDPKLVVQDNVFGCWGDEDDPYYGGRAYGEMLKVVYPRIKAANAAVQVLNGGLLLDIPYSAEDGAGLSARFIEGVFVAGAGASFDILAVHSYYSLFDSISPPDGQTRVPGSTAANDWKLPYLYRLMQAYGIQKPLFVTEGALLCRFRNGSNCLEPQANAIARIYPRALRDNLAGFVWYLYAGDGFHYTGLVEQDNPSIKRPAYAALQHSAQMLGGATFVDQLSTVPSSVEAYVFRRDDKRIIVFWSNRVQMVDFMLPEQAQPSCTTRDGAAFDCIPVAGRLSLPAVRAAKYIEFQEPDSESAP
jgi:hypothetical protein